MNNTTVDSLSRLLTWRPSSWLMLAGLMMTLGAAAALAQTTTVVEPVQAEEWEEWDSEEWLRSPEELEELVGRIALYPDDLISVVLPASTYPLQVVQAARFLEEYEVDGSREPDPEWDDSVVALLNYPEVLAMMNEDLDWTWELGEAVLDQQPDVLDAIQDFRGRAYAAGNLRDDERQTINNDGEVIEIAPADPEVIYVPYYEPTRVVVRQPAPVIYYYPYAYPVYYYPYPLGYTFARRHFWGVTSAFTIGWRTRYVHVYHHHVIGHPYYGFTYYSPYYVRHPSTIVNINVWRGTNIWRPSYRGGARPRTDVRASRGFRDVRPRPGVTRGVEGNARRAASERRALAERSAIGSRERPAVRGTTNADRDRERLAERATRPDASTRQAPRATGDRSNDRLRERERASRTDSSARNRPQAGSTARPEARSRASATSRPSDTTRPSGTATQPSGANRPSGTARPSGTNQPSTADRSSSADRPSSANRPSSADRPSGANRPSSADRSSGANRPSSTTQPSGANRPSSTARPPSRAPTSSRPATPMRPTTSATRTTPAARSTTPSRTVTPATRTTTPSRSVTPATRSTSPSRSVTPATRSTSPSRSVAPATHSTAPSRSVTPATRSTSPSRATAPAPRSTAPSRSAPSQAARAPRASSSRSTATPSRAAARASSQSARPAARTAPSSRANASR